MARACAHFETGSKLHYIQIRNKTKNIKNIGLKNNIMLTGWTEVWYTPECKIPDR